MSHSRGAAVGPFTRFPLACAAAALLLAALAPVASARPASPAPPLPAPSGTVVNVSTEAQLQAAVQNLASNTTIVVAPGTYTLTSTLWINGSFSNVAIRGSSADPNATVLVGPGMTNASYGNVPYGIWTGGNVQGVLIANLTLRNFYYHAIIFNGVTQSPHVYNVHLLDTGEQLIKSNPDGAGGGVNNGIVEYSTIEYTTTSRDYYTNGVDVYTGSNWIIRHNLFRNIVAPAGQLAGPAVLAWAHSANTIAEGNTFINCARGISFGLQDVTGFDHSGGVIRNNMFYRASNQPGDVGIAVFDSPNTLVENNTVFVSGTYGTPIEYRFANTTGVVIKNNLLDGIVFARDGATGVEAHNLAASAAMFVNAAAGDLHLSPSATSAIDTGETLAAVTDDWDGQVRPAGAGYDVGADEYAATTTTFGIAGHVRDASSAGLGGVTLTLGGSRALTTSSDAAGAFAFTGLASGGSYTVTPSAAGYTFTPGQLTYAALNANVGNADFSAASAAPTPTPTPPPPSASGPYGGTPAAVPGTIEAENYDLGGEGVAYHDTTAGNSGAVYRTDGVDLIAASDTGGGYEITNAVAGEWLKYSVNVGGAGPYTISVRVASSGTGGQFHLEFDGVNVTGAMSVPNTRGWQTWQTITKTGVSLPAGAHVMRLVLDANGRFTRQVGHFNWIRVDGAAAPTPTPTPTGPTVSLTAPANGATFTAPATVPLTAAVTGTVSRVDFYANGTLVGSASSSPYTMTGTNVAAGTYVLTAVAVPSSGASVTSAAVTITVNAPTVTPGTTPTVALTSPTSGSAFNAPATITLAATASDAADAIAKVDFYSGTTRIGTSTAAPYTITWSNVAAGSYSVTATATDASGVTATSAADAITVAGATPPPTGSGGLVYSANLVHQGSFHVPGGIHAGGQANAGFEYGGTALPFNPAKNSLYMVGHDWDQLTGEVSIPSLGGTASLLQMLVDSTEGKLASVNPSDSGSKKIGGMLALSDRLIVTGFSFYDGAGTQVLSHFSRPLSLSTKGQVTGPYRVGSLGGGFYAGYMGVIPASWQGALGGAAFTGQCCLSVISRTSYGPALFAFDPTSTGQTAVPLVYYTGSNPLEPYGAGGSHPLFNGTTKVRGVVMPEGTSSVLFFGSTGTGSYCYGQGTSTSSLNGQAVPGDPGVQYCYDPANGSKGEHAYPYAAYVWAYDANDLAAVRNGAKAPWSVRPYATWTLADIGGGMDMVGGATYDPATGRIYVSQKFGDGDLPLIHVYTIR